MSAFTIYTHQLRFPQHMQELYKCRANVLALEAKVQLGNLRRTSHCLLLQLLVNPVGFKVFGEGNLLNRGLLVASCIINLGFTIDDILILDPHNFTSFHMGSSCLASILASCHQFLLWQLLLAASDDSCIIFFSLLFEPSPILGLNRR